MRANSKQRGRFFLNGEISDETWFNAKKAVELGFADKVLFAAEEKPKKKPEEDENPNEKEEGKEPEEDGEGDEDEKKKKFPFQNAYVYSRESVTDSFLNKVTDKAPKTVPVDLKLSSQVQQSC